MAVGAARLRFVAKALTGFRIAGSLSASDYGAKVESGMLAAPRLA